MYIDAVTVSCGSVSHRLLHYKHLLRCDLFGSRPTVFNAHTLLGQAAQEHADTVDILQAQDRQGNSFSPYCVQP